MGKTRGKRKAFESDQTTLLPAIKISLSRVREKVCPELVEGASVRVIESERHPHLYPLPPKEGEEVVFEGEGQGEG